MTESRRFSFGENSVATSYDSVLVPVLFEPWANRLVRDYSHWEGQHVLDLATGTGIVAYLLSEQVGPGGRVIGTDINGEMLSLARKRCADAIAQMEFVESPAHPLDVSDEEVNVVVCQQGFQFFPDKAAAANEIYRVLQQDGHVIASTWCPVSECEFFQCICGALESIDENRIADLMRVPFDFMPQLELSSSFDSAGFVNVEIMRQDQDLVFSGGVAHAIQAAYSTPIAPNLRGLPENRQASFKRRMTELLNELNDDGLTMGKMISNVLYAEKRT